jgi:hypothetical protein
MEHMMKFNALICSAIVGLVLCFSGVLPAWAAATTSTGTGTSLTTSPVSTELVGKPGSSVTTTLQVMNNNPTPVMITLQLDTFKASGTNGQAQILSPTSADNYINWVTFSQNSFTAQPGVWTPVQMTINLPSYASLGYYYAVLFKPSQVVSSGKHTALLKGSNAILVLLNAESGTEKPKITVTSFTSVDKIYEYLPATFKIDVYNSGDIYLPPTGNIFISKSSNFKNIIDSLNINTAAGNVLPGSSRIYSEQWTDGFPVFVPKTLDGQPVTNAKGKAVDQLKWNFSQTNRFRFGKYYAKMILVYNNGTQQIPITATVSFWVIPWKLITLFLLFIACVVGLFIVVIHLSRKVKKQTKWSA